ncbi:hypothetical protein H4Q26_011165 [Puccinia striiformis f. sp. tritici PST-130]|nr:hypothetical protein H4Q26_011165 [Puccinia striiformis f. sp. tritici PST-130]
MKTSGFESIDNLSKLITHHLNKPTKEYIVLNKFHHVRSLDLGGTTYQSDRNLQFSLDYNQVHDLDYFDDRDELIDDII